MTQIRNFAFSDAERQSYEIRKRHILICLSMEGDLAENYAKAHHLPPIEELRREDEIRRTLGQGW